MSAVHAILPMLGEPVGLDALEFPEAPKALIAKRQLLRRIDSKYVVPATSVFDLLGGLGSAYAVVRVPAGSWAIYRSLYLDTPDLMCFHDHRRGRRVRHKVRIRHYPDRGVSFLEVKTKRNSLVTYKKRLAMPYGDEVLGDRELTFLRDHVASLADTLAPIARIDYRRISLVALGADERVTVDIGLDVARPIGPAHPLSAFAVVEIKQARLCASSPMLQRLVDAGHHERAVSKYCTAISELYPSARRNRLLPSLRAVARIAG